MVLLDLVALGLIGEASTAAYYLQGCLQITQFIHRWSPETFLVFFMDWIKSPYVLSAIVALPVLVLVMGLFKKNQFIVDGRVG